MFSSLHGYHKGIRIIVFFCITQFALALSPQHLLAQNSELGLELAGHYYLGDLNRKFTPSTVTLGGQFFVRKHINSGVSLRMSAGGGRLEGIDNEAFDVFSANRSASFDGRFINADFLVEYNFLDYRNDKLQQYWTPYVFFGLGLYRMQGSDGFGNRLDSGAKFRLPVGVGIKYRFNNRWVVGLSTAAIKTNSDDIDNVSANTPNIKDYSGGNPNDDDWMFYTAISISFTFHKIYCPEGWFK
jgi:opacity protein-like surface antigen